jgi:hypothetical protein
MIGGLISFANDGAMLVSAQVGDRLRHEPAKAEKRFLASIEQGVKARGHQNIVRGIQPVAIG